MTFSAFRHGVAGTATLVAIAVLLCFYLTTAPKIGLPTLNTPLRALLSLPVAPPREAMEAAHTGPEKPMRLTGGDPSTRKPWKIDTNPQVSPFGTPSAKEKKGFQKPEPMAYGLTLGNLRSRKGSADVVPSLRTKDELPSNSNVKPPVQEAVPPTPVRPGPSPITEGKRNPDPASDPSPFSMAAGQIVRGGRQMPALLIELSTQQIRALVESGRAIVFAESRSGGDLAFLDAATHQFRRIGEFKALASDRFISISDPGLTAAWAILSQSATLQVPAGFGLRLRSDFDAEILDAQMKAVVRQGVDFQQALQQGRAVQVHGILDPQLDFQADRVSVR